MPRLVIDLLVFERGKSYGFEEYALNLLHDFVRYRDRLSVSEIIIVIRETQKKFFENQFPNGLSIHIVECGSMFQRLKMSRSVPSILSLTIDDIILYPGNTMPLTGIKTKTLLIIHDLLFLHENYFLKTLGNLLFRTHRYIYIPRSLKQADHIIAISHFTKDEIIQKYRTPAKKITPIYNFFNFEKYDITNDGILNKIDGKYILTVCAKTVHKNHITLLKAFEEFYQLHNDYKLILVGGMSRVAENYYNTMSNEIKENIILKQHLSNVEMKYLYQNASIYVSASLYEGLGMPVVEALYFGCRLILSDIPVHHEVSLGKAIFFSPRSYSELCACYEKVINMKYEISDEFKDKLVKMYDTEHTSLKYIEVINNLILGINL